MDIGEWIFHDSSKNDLISMQKQICSIEQEMTYLLKLKHPNLGLYYGIKYHLDEKAITVNLLREFIHGKFQLLKDIILIVNNFLTFVGTNCNSLIFNHNSKPDLDLLKHVARELLTALEYLHRNNVVHREIDGQFVYLSDTGNI